MKARKVYEAIGDVLKPKNSGDIISGMNSMAKLKHDLVISSRKYWENIGIEYGREYTREELMEMFEGMPEIKPKLRKVALGGQYGHSDADEKGFLTSSKYIPLYAKVELKEDVLFSNVYGKMFLDNWRDDEPLFSQPILFNREEDQKNYNV